MNVKNRMPVKISVIVLFPIITALIAALMLFVLSACDTPRGPDATDIEQILKMQIDRDVDDYLASLIYDDYGDIDYLKTLHLDSIHYGSFTTGHKKEMMVFFKVLGVPHAGGFDRTIAAVYDADSLEIIMQKTFAEDVVSIYFLHGIDYDHECVTDSILFIGGTTNHGFTSYRTELYSLQTGEWKEKPMPVEETDQHLAYALSYDSILHIFTIHYDDAVRLPGNPVYEHKETLFWNYIEREFVREVPHDSFHFHININ